MKNRNAKRILAAGAAAVLAVGLTACGGKENKADDKTITVAASPTPHAEILEAAKDLLKEGHLGMIIKPTKEDLKQAIKYIIQNPEILEVYNKRIYREFNFRDVRNSADEVEKLYQ